MSKWTKTSPYGDYRDPLQNHKFDDCLIFNPKTKKFEVYRKLDNLFNEAKWFFGKHIGSKKLSKIKSINRRSYTKKSLIKTIIENNKKSENTSEETGKE